MFIVYICKQFVTFQGSKEFFDTQSLFGWLQPGMLQELYSIFYCMLCIGAIANMHVSGLKICTVKLKAY